MIDPATLSVGAIIGVMWQRIKNMSDNIVSVFWQSAEIETSTSWATKISLLRGCGYKTIKTVVQKPRFAAVLNDKDGNPIITKVPNKERTILKKGLSVVSILHESGIINYCPFFTNIDQLAVDLMKSIRNSTKKVGQSKFKIERIKPKEPRKGEGDSPVEMPWSKSLAGWSKISQQAFDPVNVSQETYDEALERFFGQKGSTKIEVINPNAQDFLRHCDFLLDKRTVFAEIGMPQQIGAHLYGPPGTGKSQFVINLAKHLECPVFILDLSIFTNSTLDEAREVIRGEDLKILLIEDIDRIFDKEKNVINPENRERLTVDAILNLLDGIDTPGCLIKIVTSNCQDNIPEALGVPGKDGKTTRPGRLDYMVEFGEAPKDLRYNIALEIFKDEESAELYSEKGKGMFVSEYALMCKTALVEKIMKEEGIEK